MVICQADVRERNQRMYTCTKKCRSRKKKSEIEISDNFETHQRHVIKWRKRWIYHIVIFICVAYSTPLRAKCWTKTWASNWLVRNAPKKLLNVLALVCTRILRTNRYRDKIMERILHVAVAKSSKYVCSGVRQWYGVQYFYIFFLVSHRETREITEYQSS